jgi:hypothetical protein
VADAGADRPRTGGQGGGPAAQIDEVVRSVFDSVVRGLFGSN